MLPIDLLVAKIVRAFRPKSKPAVGKRDELGFPSFWQLQGLGWIGVYALMVLGASPYVNREPGIIWKSTVGCLVWFLVSCALRPVCRSLVDRSLSWFRLELWALVWSSIAGTAASILTPLIILRFRWIGWAELVQNDLARNSIRSAILLLFWCNLYFNIKQWRRMAQEREHRLRSETDAREARLNALRYQLNPHFLFNSLSALSTLVLEGDISGANQMIEQISSLLCTTLQKELRLEVPLSEELAFTEQYLAIEKTRMGERLKVDFAIPAETLDAKVPSMLLQPLAENAVRHGISPLVEGGKITIQSQVRNSQLRIVVKNSGAQGAAKRSSRAHGIGLANTVERLRGVYGDHHKFDLRWLDTGGCEVTLELPLRRDAKQEEKIACA